ncbi:hypothetical protein [Rothia nasimurium]|uniref:hypothetical protein n=1 Tax=Rothia nasimurium TaxID=85336 RepID=UPI002DD65045|nr:hypothetical protein [Rothia nasimurium]
MSLEMITWAMKQDVKNSQFQVLIAIANEADSDGLCFTGQAKLAYKANVTERTLRTCITQFRDMGLLHTERRVMTFGRGRKTDAIILHPEVTAYEKAPYPHTEVDRKKAAYNRKKYEVVDTFEPVDNSRSDQPENFSGRKETPSQTQAENFSGRTINRKNHVHQPENSGVSTGKIQPYPQGALKRNARAFNPFKDPSVPHSVSSTAPVDKPQVDGLTDRKNPKEKSSPAKLQPAATKHPAPPLAAPTSQSPEAPARITRGVNHTKLRQELHQAQLNISSINDDILSQMIIIVLSRATQPVRSPQRFAYSCIAKEFYELVSLAQSTLKPQETACLAFCEVHTREHSGTCPLCVKETTGHLVTVETEPPADPEAGKALLAKLRARRLAQNPAT